MASFERFISTKVFFLQEIKLQLSEKLIKNQNISLSNKYEAGISFEKWIIWAYIKLSSTPWL